MAGWHTIHAPAFCRIKKQIRVIIQEYIYIHVHTSLHVHLARSWTFTSKHAVAADAAGGGGDDDDNDDNNNCKDIDHGNVHESNSDSVTDSDDEAEAADL